MIGLLGMCSKWTSGDEAGLGLAKGKDFASSLGPVIVTSEALADRTVTRPGVYDLKMTAKVNGIEMSNGKLKDIFWSFGESVGHMRITSWRCDRLRLSRHELSFGINQGARSVVERRQYCGIGN